MKLLNTIRILSGALFISLCCLTASCNFLEIVPVEQADLDDATQDFNSTLGFLHSCYAGIQSPVAFENTEASADEYAVPLEYSLQGYNSLKVAHNLFTGNNNDGGKWSNYYRYIGQIHLFLQELKKAPVSDLIKEEWEAEAYFLMAYYHFEVLRCYGPCPISDRLLPQTVIRKADPDFKVSLAGNYHAEIEPDLYDYCIVIGQNFPEEVRLRRAAENKRTNYYTCCTEAHPNTFTFSDPAEAVWISYYSSKKHLDGYLRWAYNSWPLEPLLDSRFRSWAGGDTYLVYPGARSCIRFERLIEGIQAHEKINILRQEFEKKGNKAGLKKIEKMLAPFNLGSMPETPAAVTVNRANQILNSL